MHIYYLAHFEQRYSIFSTDNWIVIIGEDKIIMTAMFTRFPECYLSKEKGHTSIGTIKEVFPLIEWNWLIFMAKELLSVKQVFEHTSKTYDFSVSKETMDEWWWHLDLLLKGEILFNATPLYGDVI